MYGINHVCPIMARSYIVVFKCLQFFNNNHCASWRKEEQLKLFFLLFLYIKNSYILSECTAQQSIHFHFPIWANLAKAAENLLLHLLFTSNFSYSSIYIGKKIK